MTATPLIHSLEDRRLMSASSVLPPLPHFTSIIPEPVHEYAGISQQVRVAYLPDLSVEHLSELRGTIDWGDTTTSTAGFTRDKNGGIDVIATHTYVKPGTFSIVSNLSLGPAVDPGHPVPEYLVLLGSVTSPATVDTAPPQITETVDKPFTAVLGQFNQFTLDIIFTAKINWGDGHVNYPGTLSGGDLANGNWVVSGSHTYGAVGTYLVHAYVYSKVAGSKVPGMLAQEFEVLVHVEAAK
jgi:hypothetical protein